MKRIDVARELLKKKGKNLVDYEICNEYCPEDFGMKSDNEEEFMCMCTCEDCWKKEAVVKS